MIYRCVAMFILPDADFADDAEERRSFIVLKENKSAFLCVICARLRPVNTSKHTVKSAFTGLLFLSFKPPENNKIDNNPLFRLFFYFVQNLDRFWIDSFHDFSPFG